MHARIPCLFSKKKKKKNKDGDFTSTFQINLVKCLQEFKNSMEFRNCDSNINKDKLYESVRKSLNRYI